MKQTSAALYRYPSNGRSVQLVQRPAFIVTSLP
jgi:hypothetical protein